MTIVPDIDRSVLRLTVISAKASASATVAVVIKVGGSIVAKANRSLDGNHEHRPLLQATRQAILSNADNLIAVHRHAASNLPT